MEDVRRLPRIRFGHFPTPLVEIERLSEAIGVQLLVKREDMAGLTAGGNKVRKLEFVLAQSDARRAGVLVTFGGSQSNHARETAAAAARLGKRAVLLIASPPNLPPPTGNQLLYRLLGADVRLVAAEGPSDPVMHEALSVVRAEANERGEICYIVPFGGANWAGVAAWIDGMSEIVEQLPSASPLPTAVVIASGTGSTAAGIAMGSAATGANIPVIAVSVLHAADGLRDACFALVDEASEALNVGDIGARAKELLRFDYQELGQGYGIPTQRSANVLALAAARGGLIGDLTYTAKALAGVSRMVEEGDASRGPIIYVHSGGFTELFARPHEEVLEGCR